MYAGFWKRFAALIIDGIVIFGVFVIVSVILGLLHLGRDVAGYVVWIYLLAWLLYWPLMESSHWQATLGKQALGIKVTDVKGQRIDFVKALLRHLLKILSYVILYIGFLMAAFTEKKQALHDMIAGCLVVNKDYSPDNPAAQAQKNSAALVIVIVVVSVLAVLVIIGILAALALPQYTRAVEKSRAAEALVILNSAQMSRNRTDFNNWKDAPVAIPAAINDAQPNVAETKYYAFVLTPRSIVAIRKAPPRGNYAFVSGPQGVTCVVEREDIFMRNAVCGSMRVTVNPELFH